MNNTNLFRNYALIVVCLLYLTFSLACDPLIFRQIDFMGNPMSGTALIYGSLYVFLSMITRIAGRPTAIKLVILLHFFDFVFTYILYLVNLLPAPDSFKNLLVFNTLIPPLPTLFWAGLLGGVAAGIADVIIFGFLQKRIKHFLLASIISTAVILTAHNIPTDYIALRYIFPETYKTMILINTVLEIGIAFIFTMIANWVLKNIQTQVVPQKTFILVIITLFYLTLSLACDPLVFRQISLFGHVMSGSALLYGALYVLLDMLTRVSGKQMAIRLVFILHFFDFLFTYILYLVNSLPAPAGFKNLTLFNTLIDPMPTLFWAGILGGIIAGIVDVIVYNFFQKRIKNFFLASFISTTIILFAHNIPTYYFTFRHIFPTTYKEMTIINTSVEATIAMLFALVATWFFKRWRITMPTQ